jgi:hypothetical protein
MEEYGAMGHTLFAPIVRRTNATFMMLKNANKNGWSNSTFAAKADTPLAF